MFPSAEVYRDDIGYDVDELQRRATECDVVVCVNPNSPTGTTVSTERLHRLAADHPGTVVIVDESFIDFSKHPSLVYLLEADPLPNAIILKSLSKTLGVPGVRLGYVYSANREFTRFVGERLPIWNMNAFAEYMLEIILKHRDSLADSFTTTAGDRERLVAGLREIPGVAQVFPSGGNFVMFELAQTEPADVVQQLLAVESIYVKDVSAKFGGRPRLRVAVRLPAENARLLRALSTALSEASAPARQRVAVERRYA
jgi:histidinol-phosphate/aromatic aminotransferase/cobyric acid decarboxylase-like protein